MKQNTKNLILLWLDRCSSSLQATFVKHHLKIKHWVNDEEEEENKTFEKKKKKEKSYSLYSSLQQFRNDSWMFRLVADARTSQCQIIGENMNIIMSTFCDLHFHFTWAFEIGYLLSQLSQQRHCTQPYLLGAYVVLRPEDLNRRMQSSLFEFLMFVVLFATPCQRH